MGLRGRIERLERKSAQDMIRIARADCSVVVFPAPTFWQQLFLDEVSAACGEHPDSEVALALDGATVEDRKRLEALVLEQGGDFLRRALDIDGRLLVVAQEPSPDMWEGAGEDPG